MVSDFETLGDDTIKAGTRLYICLSSRHYPYIDIRNGIRLIVEDQAGHTADMERYVREHFRSGTGELVDEIIAEILRKAGGIFMWVVLASQYPQKI